MQQQLKNFFINVRTLYVFVFGALLIIGVAYAQSTFEEPFNLLPVTRGDIRKTISTVGMVISERDTPLRFVSSDSISHVLVKQGQTVRKGQKLASVNSDGLSAAMMTAAAAVKTAQSRLEALEHGTRPEEIAVIEAQMEGKRAEMRRLEQQLLSIDDNMDVSEETVAARKQNAADRLGNTVAMTNTVVSSQLVKVKTALATLESVFNRLDVQDAIVKSLTNDAALLHTRQLTLEPMIDMQMDASFNAIDAETALQNIQSARDLITPVADLFRSATTVLSRLPATNYFTSIQQDDAGNAVAAQQSIILETLSRLDDARKNIQEDIAHLDGQIIDTASTRTTALGGKADIEAQILALVAALNVEEAQLALKTAPPLSTDIAQATARVREAQGNLARVSAEYQKTILVSPIDGIVMTVNLTAGQPPPLTEPAVIVRSDAPHSVLVNLSETEVASIAVSNTGTIVFENMPHMIFPLQMDAIAESSTKIDGIGNYRKLPFRNPHPELTDGMSGNVTIVLAERRNVLTVPTSLIITDGEGSTVVRVKRGDEVQLLPVVIGLQGDDGMTEVKHDMTEHDALVVTDSGIY